MLDLKVETVRRGLEPAMVGARFLAVEQRRPDLRFPFPDLFANGSRVGSSKGWEDAPNISWLARSTMRPCS